LNDPLLLPPDHTAIVTQPGWNFFFLHFILLFVYKASSNQTVLPTTTQGEIHSDTVNERETTTDPAGAQVENVDAMISFPYSLTSVPTAALLPVETILAAVRTSLSNSAETRADDRREGIISDSADDFLEFAVIGSSELIPSRNLYFNVHDPFCAVVVGTQGKGKSHTTNAILESCLADRNLESALDGNGPLFRVTNKMSAIVLHYDDGSKSPCESIGVGHYALSGDTRKFCEVKVFVSSTNPDRMDHYREGGYDVTPLYFNWKDLGADHLKKLMGVKPDDTQLYMSTMLNLLRGYQKNRNMPEDVGLFIDAVSEKCNVRGQSGPLSQRIDLLKEFVSSDNAFSVSDVCKRGTLVIFDLSDPLYSKNEIAGIFEVLVEMYRSVSTEQLPAKVLVLDEAHKYMDTDSSTSQLAEALVEVARNMRHDGMRLVISTQNPKVLLPELLELSSVVFMHGFHSKDWFQYLSAKLALGNKEQQEELFEDIVKLTPGNAVAFIPAHCVRKLDTFTLKIKVRARITQDLGGTVRNV
jgi:hypothetical protein